MYMCVMIMQVLVYANPTNKSAAVQLPGGAAAEYTELLGQSGMLHGGGMLVLNASAAAILRLVHP
jgi:hypothetical protein